MTLNGCLAAISSCEIQGKRRQSITACGYIVSDSNAICYKSDLCDINVMSSSFQLHGKNEKIKLY